MGVIEILMGILVLFAGLFGFDLDSSDEEGIRVASFNAQIFGDSKIDKVGVDYYVDLVRDYDVLFLLEIRDKDGSSFDEVCNLTVGYSCLVSNRSGRSISKEQVGVFYRDGINVTDYGEVEDSGDFFERDPFWVEFSFSDDRFYVLHLKPDDVSSELEALELVVSSKELVVDKDVVLIGDLNADCRYYSERVHFLDWDWVIGDGADTTVGKSDCAYDRVVVSEGVRVLGSGIVEVDSEVSDHHLIWVEIGE